MYTDTFALIVGSKLKMEFLLTSQCNDREKKHSITLIRTDDAHFWQKRSTLVNSDSTANGHVAKFSESQT